MKTILKMTKMQTMHNNMPKLSIIMGILLWAYYAYYYAHIIMHNDKHNNRHMKQILKIAKMTKMLKITKEH